ncbi:unnamed protein product [Ambrosiozyma monospora]|uniref:Unnamed protein product n=1 Tax=Ambrosiozyma monospora TaxID=43982 RepID=A0ACB5UAP5_AMBMO|nr:unnamed protein product [Ambrosiozyma monospora]
MIFMNGDGTVDTGKFGELNQHNEGFRSLLEFAGDQSKENKLVKVETTRKVETFNDNANEEFSSDQHEITTNGTIAASTYSRYLKLSTGVFGFTVFPLVIFLLFVCTFGYVFLNVWLSYWAKQSFPLTGPQYQGIYISIIFGTITSLYLCMCLESYMVTNSSKFLHLMSLDKVFNAPMSFIDTNPIGRILNRFTTDTDVLDNEIIDQLKLFIHSGGQIVGVLILCICYLPWFAIAVPNESD